MALRLAGERALAIRGADNQGWIREIIVQDALSGLKVNQSGAGRVFDFQDAGVSKLYLPDGGNVSLVGSLVFDLTNDLIVTPANPAAPRTLTIPDPGANDSFAFLSATQTLTGKTLTSPIVQGTVGAGSGLTMPAFTAGGNITGGSSFQVATSAGDLQLNPAAGLVVTGPIRQQTYSRRVVIQKGSIADNVATSILRVETTNEAGTNDAGVWALKLLLLASTLNGVATYDANVYSGEYLIVRAVKKDGTGVTSAVTAGSTAGPTTTGATNPIVSVTVTTIETSEYQVDLQVTVDYTPGDAGIVRVTVLAELLWDTFTTAPTLTAL